MNAAPCSIRTLLSLGSQLHKNYSLQDKNLKYFSLATNAFFSSKNAQLTFQFHDIGYRGLYLCCGDVLTAPPTTLKIFR